MFGKALKNAGKYGYRVIKDEINFTSQFQSVKL